MFSTAITTTTTTATMSGRQSAQFLDDTCVFADVPALAVLYTQVCYRRLRHDRRELLLHGKILVAVRVRV